MKNKCSYITYESYSEVCCINNKKATPVVSYTAKEKVIAYGELYDRIQILFPKESVVITNIPIENIEFNLSPTNKLFALCKKMEPGSLVQIKDIMNKKKCCDYRYNDSELVCRSPASSSYVGFINGVCELLYEKTYYDLFYASVAQPHKGVYYACNGKKKGIGPGSSELGEITEYINDNNGKVNYTAFAEFLVNLYE